MMTTKFGRDGIVIAGELLAAVAPRPAMKADSRTPPMINAAKSTFSATNDLSSAGLSSPAPDPAASGLSARDRVAYAFPAATRMRKRMPTMISMMYINI